MVNRYLFNSNFLNRNECEQIWRWAWKFVKLIQAIKVCRWFCVLIKVYFKHLIFFFKCVLVGKTTNKVIFGSFHCNRHDAQKFTKIGKYLEFIQMGLFIRSVDKKLPKSVANPNSCWDSRWLFWETKSLICKTSYFRSYAVIFS